LIGKFIVRDGPDTGLICAAEEHTAEFASCFLNASGKDEGGVAEVYECHLTAVTDTPTVAKCSGKVGLAAVRDNSGRHFRIHGCIVMMQSWQGATPVVPDEVELIDTDVSVIIRCKMGPLRGEMDD